jgi:hypothetical protein
MHKKKVALTIIVLSALLIATSCKKNNTPKANGNTAHALSNQFYIRGLLDTTWVYLYNDNRDECQTTGSVCTSFLTFGPNSSVPAAKFDLTDSAHAAPKDSTILSWAGKTFVTASDTGASHAYLFRFEYPDTLGREMSTDYIRNNSGATLKIDSVVYDGLAQYYMDSAGNPLKSYRIKGTFNCKLTHFGDSTNHAFTQGVYSFNVIESK